MAHLHHGAAGLKPSCRKSTQRATGTALLLRGADRPLLQIQVLRRLQAKLIPGLDRTKTMPAFVPAAPQLTPVSFIRVRQPGMTTNPLSTLHPFDFLGFQFRASSARGPFSRHRPEDDVAGKGRARLLARRAVRSHTDCRGVLLYVERWLRAPGRWRTAASFRGLRERRRAGSSP